MCKILWIEDQPDQGIERIIEAIKEDYPDYKIKLEGNPEEAISLLQKNEYDLIILDIRLLPKSGPIPDGARTRGKKILQDLRNESFIGKTPCDVPVIIFSAIINGNDKFEIMSVSPSPLAYLDKPVVLKDFLKVLSGHFGAKK